MLEEFERPHHNPNAGNTLNIIGLVLGILAFILALIPCTFFIGLPLGIVGLILSIVGYNQAKQGNAATGLGLGGIILCALAIVVSGIWITIGVIGSKNSKSSYKYYNKEKRWDD